MMKSTTYLWLARSQKTLTWLARLSIALVFVWNIQCAISFLVWPGRYSASYELSGTAGEATIRGIGVLFLMWNIPYAVALWHPLRHRISLYESTVMQALGLMGEGFIYLKLSPDHLVLHGSLLRFILFDAGGLILLLLAVWFVHRALSIKPAPQACGDYR